MGNNSSSSRSGAGVCREIARGVYCMEAGKGVNRANVYFVRSGSSWVLIDTASANCSRLIRKAAEQLFGANTPPASILLTHDHPDHAGAALELAGIWRCLVYLHPDELPLAVDGSLTMFKKYANPLDRWLILPLLQAMPRKKVEAMLAKSSLKGVCRSLEPGAGVPGLPDWRWMHTPGHTPGHVAFFRAGDRVLITGDAVVTADLNSLPGMVSWSLRLNRQRVSGPPWYSTWNWRAAKESVTALAGLEPRVLAPGHGIPLAGDDTARQLRAFAGRFSAPATGKNATN